MPAARSKDDAFWAQIGSMSLQRIDARWAPQARKRS